MEHPHVKKFIIVNPGTPVYLEDGLDGTGGILGVLDEGNVYVTTYAAYDDQRAEALAVGERAQATFNLSGEKGVYEVVRIQ